MLEETSTVKLKELVSESEYALALLGTVLLVLKRPLLSTLMPTSNGACKAKDGSVPV